MYAWYVYFSSSGDVVDGGIWRSVNGGTSWLSISNSGITNCGDGYGCGVQQGTYNLELLATPNGGATDLYAGTINLYKCQISALNPSCTTSPFINLTHVYGCIPVAAPSHVHPDQHALAAMIPSGGGGGGGQPPPPVTYHITVTGTSSGTPPDAGQSTTVTLVVN